MHVAFYFSASCVEIVPTFVEEAREREKGTFYYLLLQIIKSLFFAVIRFSNSFVIVLDINLVYTLYIIKN